MDIFKEKISILKKNGTREPLNLNKISKRIHEQSKGLRVNADEIVISTISGLFDGVTSSQLDELAAKTAGARTTLHPDYSKLASNLAVSKLQKEIKTDISGYRKRCEYLLHESVIKKLKDWQTELLEIVDFKRDFNFDYFGINTMLTTYLLRDIEGKLLELPQHCYLRTCLYLTDTIEEFKELYDTMSNQYISLATPVLINGGTNRPSMISCSLHWNKGDSLEEINQTFGEIARHSADSSGIGLCVDNLRSNKSRIHRTGGFAHGIIPYAKLVEDYMVAYNQSGKRLGSCAVYMSAWHKDIFDFLELKKEVGAEKKRARDLFLAINCNDNFMRAVDLDEDYYLFCPNDLLKAGLSFDKSNKEFEDEYSKAILLGIGEKIRARDLMRKICETQIESGLPYLLYIDSVNRKTNHSFLGRVKQSNLCIEILSYTDADTTAQCCLGAIPLFKCVKDKEFNFKLLAQNVKTIVYALNKVIDRNYYSTLAAKNGGLKQRQIGIGTMGLADAFFEMDLVFVSDEAKALNKKIEQYIYYYAIEASCDYSKEFGVTYDKFEESDFSKGICQFDYWKKEDYILNEDLNWSELKERMKLGMANSLLTAKMPTATTSNLIGAYESFEPIGSNIFTRETKSGEFTIFNKYLIEDLIKLNIWKDNLRKDIIDNKGSVQRIDFLKYFDGVELTAGQQNLIINQLKHIKDKYLTVFEIKQKQLINMAKDRSPFIDQSQSMNIYIEEPSINILTTMHLYSWSIGLKTGIYYLRSKSKLKPNKAFGVDLNDNSIKLASNYTEDNCVGCSV